MNHFVRIMLVLSVGFCRVLIAQDTAHGADLSCAASLELPTRGLLAARAGSSGTVAAVIRIGKGGKMSALRLTGKNEILKAEVRVAIGLSHFTPRCAGRSLRVEFGFTLEDPPTPSIIPPAVRFIPPNRFELTFRRVMPNVD